MRGIAGPKVSLWLLSLAFLLALVLLLAFQLTAAVPNAGGQDIPPPPDPTLVPPGGPDPSGRKPLLPGSFDLFPLLPALVPDQVLGPARVLETLCIPADGSPSQTSVKLNQGTTYTVRVTGTYVWGGCDPFTCPGGAPDYLRWGDGEYLTDDHWHTFADPYWLGFIHLKINGIDYNLGAYDPGHLYALQIPGNDKQASFKVEDCSYCYPDNSGCLRVEVLDAVGAGAFDLGVKPLQQCGLPATTQSRWGSAPYGDPATSNPASDTICAWGCNLTSWAMLVDYWGWRYGGFHTNPRELNDWLRSNDGYNRLYVDRWKVAEYAREKLGAAFLIGQEPWDPDRLQELLELGYPVILKEGNHFVTATGQTASGDGRTWYLNDPGGPGADVFRFPLTTLQERYRNQASRMDWGLVVDGPANLASLSIALASPAELLVTNPAGQRSGLDPRMGIRYDEIPGATYATEELGSSSGRTAPPLKVFDLPAGLEGDYIIQVIGTGNGPYTLDVLAYDTSGKPVTAKVSGEIQPGMVHVYRVGYGPEPGLALELVRVPAVVIQKETKPKGGTGFSFSHNLGASGDFFLDDDQVQTFADVDPGQYEVVEQAPELNPSYFDLARLTCVDSEEAGAASSGDRATRTANIQLDPQETVICTFTNIRLGKIIVEKKTEPGGDPAVFPFCGTIQVGLRDGEREGRDVERGTFTVQESTPPGWALTGITCTDSDSSGDLETATATYQVKAGEKVLCTFTGARMGAITVEKQTEPSGSDQVFSFAGALQAQLKDDETASVQVAPGRYSVWETFSPGWYLDAIQCDDDDSLSDASIGMATFDVEPGEEVTCRFSNRQETPAYGLYLPLVLRSGE